MADSHPSTWDPGSTEAIVATVAHALRHQGRKVTHDADRLVAFAAAERIVEALRRSYTITPTKDAKAIIGQ